MYSKRGQITIFIIVAVLVVAAIILFFVLRGDSDFGRQNLSPEATEINNYVESCMEDVGREVIFQVGEGGGYFLSPELSIDSGVAYYFLNSQNYMPNKKEVEEEISFFVSEKLFFCTKNFVDFPEYRVSQGDISSETSIKEGKVVIETNYPLAIEKEGSVSRIENFKVEIDSGLNRVYGSVKEFMKTNQSNGICLSCLQEISEREDLYVDMFDATENATTIFAFEDRNYKLNNETFEWVFANDYE